MREGFIVTLPLTDNRAQKCLFGNTPRPGIKYGIQIQP